MQLGLGVLRLSPRDFWAMTPRELEAALSAGVAHAPRPMARPDLERLMQLFPDDQ
jgi:uncharacterized phage protein (TIGR02216 family)